MWPIQVDYCGKILYEAIRDNNWQAAKEFLDTHGPSALSAIITPAGQTALHVAVQYGRAGIVDDLLSLIPPQNLEIMDSNGFTPLATAAYSGVTTRIAESLVNKNSNALSIPTQHLLPVSYAFCFGYEEMGRYLYSVTPLEVLKSQNSPLGAMLLRYCLLSGCLDLFLDLLLQCKELIFATCTTIKGGWSPITGIAATPSAFPSGTQLVFWKRWIYNYISIQPTTTTNHIPVDIQHKSKSERIQGLGLPSRLISKFNVYNLLGMREIYEQKLTHAQAAQILSLVCESLRELISASDTRVMLASSALLGAAQEGNVEFVEKVAKANTELLLIWPSENWKAFYYAIQYRQAEVFNLLHGFRFKKFIAATVDASGNGLLHVAGSLAPSSQLNRISGAALQMQSELQWFKEVESVIPSAMRVYQNREGKTPDDIFKESHKELRNEGEKWMKDTASSCSLVGALIVTIVFAAAFTVPGGNNQESGYPIFLDKEKLFMLFVVSDALSLFSSTTSVLMFLGILTSRYAEEDFLISLPRKLIIGLSTLFLSIATMMIAFSATILIMVQHRSHSWAVLPVIMLASVPITIFVLLQFPLLVRMVFSTYGPGIFKRNMKPWP